MDCSNFRVVASTPTPEIAVQVKELADKYTGGSYFHEDVDGCALHLGANDVDISSVEHLHDDLLKLVEETGEDFAWEVNSEPAYEWLGSIRMHTPGLEDFDGSCDADANVVISTDWLLKTVADATDLADLKAAIAEASGNAHRGTA